MQSSESNFTVPPFPPFPAASRYVALGSVEEAIDRVTSSTNGGDGIALVMGPPGVGKSIVCNVLAKKFASSRTVVVLGDVAITSSDSFYRRVLDALGVDVTSVANGDMQLAVIQSVSSAKIADGGILLLIDEAQSLSAEVLESIRVTTNIMKDGQPRVSAVLCGGPKLDETLASPAMEPFNQRVATRCYLHPLNSHETRYYINEVIRSCGSDPEKTITDEAIGAIHHASSGIPRLINQMMTEAIDCAADEDETLICERVIDLAWAQLQQLPSPIIEETKIASDSAPVELGSLDDSIEFGELSPEVSPAAEVVVPAASTTMPEPSVQQEPVVSQQSNVSEQCDAVNECCTAQESSERQECSAAHESSAAQTCGGDHEMQVAASAIVSEECPTRSAKPESAVPQSAVPTAIFGDFEREESVSVEQPSESVSLPPSEEVEMRLQTDVIQLREMATQARFGGVEESNIAGDMFERSRHFDLPGGSACPAPIWIDEEEAESDLQIRSNGNDDSDLLIIEDEVDVVPRSLQQPSGAKGRTMKVDYQQMLASMRTSG